jgi:predicted nucleotidyltransferase
MTRTHVPIPRDAIAAFCEKWNIKEFYFFGSVLRDDFSPTSDVDVAVRFAPEAKYSLFDLVDMEDELTAIFGRDVDLLTLRAIEHMPNPLRRRAILESLELVHAA